MVSTLGSITTFLLSIAGIFLIGALGEVISQRTKVADAVWLIIAGIALGPVLGWVTPDVLRVVAPYFAALALVMVLFEAGTALKLDRLSKAAPRAALLSLNSLLFSVLALALCSRGAALLGLLPEAWSWSHSLLLATILGGPSAAIVMPTLAQARLPAKISSLLHLESALTDAACVVAATALVDLMVGQGASPGLAFARASGIGLAIGAIVGLVWLLFLRLLHSNEHAYPVTLSALLILHVVIDSAGGSAALGTLTVAVALGNAPLLGSLIGLRDLTEVETELAGLRRQMAFIVKSFFFVFIGAMLAPSWALLGLGGVLGLVALGSRVPAVKLATAGAGWSRQERAIVTFAAPRGMVAGILATLPMARGLPGTEQLPLVVFACITTTTFVFSAGFPALQARQRMTSKANSNEPVNGSRPLPTLSRSQLRTGSALPRPSRTGFEGTALELEAKVPGQDSEPPDKPNS